MVVIYFSGIANGNNTLQISCFCRRYNDGFGDVVIEAPKSRPGGGGGSVGQAYVAFSRPFFTSFFELSSLNGNNSFRGLR